MPLRNFHLPLPSELYEQLRKEAARSGRPATTIAREALGHWLRQSKKAAIADAISEYARKHAGSPIDLDEELEMATIDHLRDDR